MLNPPILALSTFIGLAGLGVALTQATTTSTNATNFTLCKSTYALCTTAMCKPVPGQKGNLLCGCSVRTGYSAGTQSCKSVQHVAAGDVIYSRYYPVKAYAVCSNSRPWAWCLDVPCLIDRNHPSRASCRCTAVNDENPYIVVTDKYTKSTCTTGIISSATLQGIKQIDDFIQSKHLLPAFTVKVFNMPKP